MKYMLNYLKRWRCLSDCFSLLAIGKLLEANWLDCEGCLFYWYIRENWLKLHGAASFVLQGMLLDRRSGEARLLLQGKQKLLDVCEAASSFRWKCPLEIRLLLLPSYSITWGLFKNVFLLLSRSYCKSLHRCCCYKLVEASILLSVLASD